LDSCFRELCVDQADRPASRRIPYPVIQELLTLDRRTDNPVARRRKESHGRTTEHSRVVGVIDVDVAFCFYDDPDFRVDADSDSRVLQSWHGLLWTKELPGGFRIEWSAEEESTCLVHNSHLGNFRISSDTIASTHERYVPDLWASVDEESQRAFNRAFYTVGGFIVFPRHPGSLNQRRGWDRSIADRFDLTLECIRRHYLELDPNPLGAVLSEDAAFFGLFGSGASGFQSYVEFFHLQDLVDGLSVRWLDGTQDDTWSFSKPALPGNAIAYRRYLESLRGFVEARNERIARWAEAH